MDERIPAKRRVEFVSDLKDIAHSGMAGTHSESEDATVPASNRGESMSPSSSLGAEARGDAPVTDAVRASCQRPYEDNIESTSGDAAQTPTRTPQDASKAANAANYLAGASKRRSLTAWIGNLTGEQPPSVSDSLFRKFLRNGIVLCKLMAAIHPEGGCNAPHDTYEASDPQCSRANVEAFLEACRRFGIPEEHLLNAEDLADPTYTDRPGVVESLLFLRSHAEDHSASATHVDPGAPPLAAAVSPSRRSSHWDHAHEGPYRTHAPSDAPSVLRGSPVHGGRGADARATLAEVITGVRRSIHMDVHASRSSVGRQSAYAELPAAIGDADSVSRYSAVPPLHRVPRLSQLASRLSSSSPRSPGMGLIRKSTSIRGSHAGARMSGAFGRGEDVDGDTVGPVMESVIRSLTDEYERQLIAKEEALKRTESELTNHRTATVAAKSDMEELRKDLADTRAALREKEVEMREAAREHRSAVREIMEDHRRRVDAIEQRSAAESSALRARLESMEAAVSAERRRAEEAVSATEAARREAQRATEERVEAAKREARAEVERRVEDVRREWGAKVREAEEREREAERRAREAEDAAEVARGEMERRVREAEERAEAGRKEAVEEMERRVKEAEDRAEEGRRKAVEEMECKMRALEERMEKEKREAVEAAERSAIVISVEDVPQPIVAAIRQAAVAEARAAGTVLPAGSTSALTQARTEVAALRHQLDVVKAEALSGFEEMRKGLREAARSTGQLADISGKLAKARKDNRELHNQVQDLKGQVRVFCRVRPVGTTGDPSEAVVDADAEESEVVLSVPGVSGASRAFAFDRVFGPGASQADVFNEVQPLVRSVMDGYNVCIFAYGQTGSGKTHTMTGPSGARRAEGERGVNWRALDELFRLREERVVEGWQVEIEVQSLEIYNDQVRDLLASHAGPDARLVRDSWMGDAPDDSDLEKGPCAQEHPPRRTLVGRAASMRLPGASRERTKTPPPQRSPSMGGSPVMRRSPSDVGWRSRPEASTSRRSLSVMSTQRSGLNVPDAVTMRVDSAADVARMMSRAEAARQYGQTKMNERSSRSHCVTCVVVRAWHPSDALRQTSCLNLIDLAGSERVERSGAEGERLKETGHINKSLSALGDVMSALQTRSKHVPYRNSKLTLLLQDSLQGAAKTMMFLHVAPEASSHGESLSTLQFGQKVSSVSLGQATRGSERVAAPREPSQSAREALEARARSEGYDAAVAKMRGDLDQERLKARRAMDECDALRKQIEELQRAAEESGRRDRAVLTRQQSRALMSERSRTPVLSHEIECEDDAYPSSRSPSSVTQSPTPRLSSPLPLPTSPGELASAPAGPQTPRKHGALQEPPCPTSPTHGAASTCCPETGEAAQPPRALESPQKSGDRIERRARKSATPEKPRISLSARVLGAFGASASTKPSPATSANTGADSRPGSAIHRPPRWASPAHRNAPSHSRSSTAPPSGSTTPPSLSRPASPLGYASGKPYAYAGSPGPNYSPVLSGASTPRINVSKSEVFSRGHSMRDSWRSDLRTSREHSPASSSARPRADSGQTASDRTEGRKSAAGSIARHIERMRSRKKPALAFGAPVVSVAEQMRASSKSLRQGSRSGAELRDPGRTKREWS